MKRLRALTRANLRKWLEAHKRGDDVGAIASPCGCPLARFVKSTLPKGNMDVFGQYESDYFVGVVPERIEINVFTAKAEKIETFYVVPKWAQDFILGVDMSGVEAETENFQTQYSLKRYINREEALELLSTL